MKLLSSVGEFIFEIADTGVGIASNRVPFIFEPFEQADNSITRKFGGTGLGLTITKKMCDLMGGKISVHSVENLGTTFRVALPLTPANSLNDRKSEIQTLNILNNESYEILVVEDNEINQQLMKILVRQLGARCVQAYNGSEGLEHLKSHQPDLIIMDIHMPVMDGMEAIRLIRSQPQFNHIPIICLTADAFSDQQRKAILLGANDYLTKPIELHKLVEIFNKYFGQQKVKTSVA
jgi:CheY-like chemotaxis protein